MTIPERHAGGFSEQVGVSAGAGEGQDKDVILNRVEQQPIIFDMAITKSCQISSKGMVAVLRRERFARRKNIDHGFKLGHIGTSLELLLQFLTELLGAADWR